MADNERACRFCDRLVPDWKQDEDTCEEHCSKSSDDKHDANGETAVIATADMIAVLIDVNCRFCGQSGSTVASFDDVSW